MPGIGDYAALLERLRSHKLKITGSKCLVVRNRNAPCRRCAEACASGCITLNGNDLSIEPEECIGCGTCATACPTGAIAPREPDDNSLVSDAVAALQANAGVAVLACVDIRNKAQGRFDPDKVTSVTCLGRIDESALALIASAGARDIRLVRGACEECPYKAGIKTAERVVESATTIFDVWGSKTRVKISERFPSSCRVDGKAAYDGSKRDFLRGVKDEGEVLVHETANYAIDGVLGIDDAQLQRPPHVTAGGVLPTSVPARRMRLLSCLRAFGEPRDELVDTRLWGHVIIDADACTGCKMCAVFCPTGALSIYDEADGDADSKGLIHAPGVCLKCRTCEGLCPASALELSEEVFAVDVNAGFVERYPLRDIRAEKGGPDAIRNSMARLIDTKYLWG